MHGAKGRARRIGSWCLTAAVLGGGCGAASERGPGRMLSSDEIRALFSDHTVRGHHDLHGYDFHSYYTPQGTFESHQSDRSDPRPARWWVEPDAMCIEWQDTPGALCRPITQDAVGYRKMLDRGHGLETVVTFHEFVPGPSPSP